MPHDCLGRLIEKNDIVKVKEWDQQAQKPIKAVKKVESIYPGADTCNLTCADFEPRKCYSVYTASESELVLKADGSDPVVPVVEGGKPE